MSVLTILPQGYVIAVISVGLSLVSILVRKKVTDQAKVKAQREELKELQRQQKEAQKAGDSKRVSELVGKMMEINSDMMKHSMKPMIFTLIPFLLVFSWLGSTYDHTMTEFTVVNPLPSGVTLTDVNASEGGFYNQSANLMLWRKDRVEPGNWSTLYAEFSSSGIGDFKMPAVAYYKTSRGDVRDPVSTANASDFTFQKTVEDENGRVKVTLFYNNTKSNIVASLGGFELGWLGWYFLCSMAGSLALNKLFNVV